VISGRLTSERRWLQRRAEWDLKFSKQHAAFRVQKAEDYKKASASGWLTRDLHGTSISGSLVSL
jgi:hypothetical protein